MQPARGIEIRKVVEAGRRAQTTEEQSGGVGALLDEASARVDVGNVRADAECGRELVRRVHACGVALVIVVRADDHAMSVVLRTGKKELRALTAPRHRQRVVQLIAGLE